MKVLATAEVNEYWENLITILYEEGYFGSERFAKRYVDELIYEIKTNLPYRTSKPAPKRFEKYGKELRFTSFKKNRRICNDFLLAKHAELNGCKYGLKFPMVDLYSRPPLSPNRHVVGSTCCLDYLTRLNDVRLYDCFQYGTPGKLSLRFPRMFQKTRTMLFVCFF
jgi:hypothetical protein